MWGELHEAKRFDLQLPGVVSPGKANRLLRTLGYTLHYDVYTLPAETSEPWQSPSLLNLELFYGGKEVDAQDDFDRISAVFLFASRPSCDQALVLDSIDFLATAFGATVLYKGTAYERIMVQEDWDTSTSFLMKEWGEEPGSHSLRRMIDENRE